MDHLSNSSVFFKPEAAASPSTGTAFDGGWHRWWQIEAANQNTDWKSLLAAADAALSRLRAIHGASS